MGTNFDPRLTAYPLSFCGGAFQVKSANPKTPSMGPAVDFDSKKIALDITGTVVLLGNSISTNVKISKTHFSGMMHVVFLGFALTANVDAGVGGDGKPGSFTAKLVAEGSALRKVGNAVTDLITALAAKATAAVDAAKKGVNDAKRKVTDAQNKVNSASRSLDSAKGKLQRACNHIFGDELLARQTVMKILAEQNYDLDFEYPVDFHPPADQDLDVPVSGDDHSVLMSMSSEYETLDQVPDDPLSSRLMTDAAIEIFAQEQVRHGAPSNRHTHAPARRLLSHKNRGASKMPLDEDVDATLADDLKTASASKLQGGVSTKSGAESRVELDTKSGTKSRHKGRAMWGHRWHRWHVHHRHRPHLLHRHRPHLHHRHRPHIHIPHFHTAAMIKAAKDAIARAAQKAKEAACAVATAPFKLLLEGAKLALRGVSKVLEGAKWTLKKLEEGLAAVLKKMKDGLAAAKGIFGVEYMSAGATIKKNLLQSSISASIKLIINKKRYTFAGSINLSSIKSFVTMVFHNVVKKMSSLFGEMYTVEQVLAMDEAQMDEMFMQTSASFD